MALRESRAEQRDRLYEAEGADNARSVNQTTGTAFTVTENRPDAPYSTTDLRALTGATERQVNDWRARNIIVPADGRQGSGTPAYWTETDVLRCRLLASIGSGKRPTRLLRALEEAGWPTDGWLVVRQDGTWRHCGYRTVAAATTGGVLSHVINLAALHGAES